MVVVVMLVVMVVASFFASTKIEPAEIYISRCKSSFISELFFPPCIFNMFATSFSLGIGVIYVLTFYSSPTTLAICPGGFISIIPFLMILGYFCKVMFCSISF